MQDPELTQPSGGDSSGDLTQPSQPSYEQMTQPSMGRPDYTVPHQPPPQPNYPPQGAYQPPPQPPRQAAPKRPPKRRRFRRGCMPGPGCLFGCFGILGGLAILGVVFLFLVYFQLSARLDEQIDELESNLDSIDNPEVTSGFESTFIYDRNGKQLWEIFGQGRRQRVDLDAIPEAVLHATVSVEDDDFYTNPGFDVRSNVRAVGQFIQEGEAVSGASTITQQVVRNVIFDPEYRAERSVERKLEEIALATVLTQRKSKDEILELYLNTIYYGNLAYGIEAASQVYFGKSASELEVHEAALLAGLPQLPAVIDPLNPDPDIQAQVIARQHLVIDLMVKEEYLTEDEATIAKSQTLNYVSPEVPLQAPHFTLYAQEELEVLLPSLGYGREFITDGGLRVYTTVDLDFQQLAQRAAETTVRQLRDAHNLTNASVVVIHPPSGEILAMVGSIDYNNAAIDGEVNVSIAQRQPGSTVKPFTYAAAMEQGWTAGTILWDVETDFAVQGQADYTPLNYDRRFHGPVRLRDALANSYNIPAVLANEFVGVDYLISFLQRMGTQSLSNEPGRYGLSLTLGGGEITLLEMTTNYATLAREGNYVPSQSILCIIDKNDNIIYQYENRCPDGNVTNQTRNAFVSPTPVLDPRIAFVVSDILSDNAARTPAMGGNSPLNTGSLLTSVKTGTTDNFRDNWTVGYTRDLAVGVWSGNSDNSEMINVSGLVGAAPIWNTIMTGVYSRFEMPPSVLNPPAGMDQRRICNINGMRDPVTSCPLRSEWFLNSAPLVPDGQGNLIPYGSDPQAFQAPPPSEFGPRIVETEAGIYQVHVRPLDPLQQNIAQAQFGGLAVAPQYCMVPVEVLGSVFDAQEQLFIGPPAAPDRQTNAYRYAINAGIPILPQVPCTAETITTFANVDPNASGQILSPTNGQTVSGNVEIFGVVNYPDGYQFDFYKIDVRGGPFADWTTIGNTHANEVLQPAVLETFFAEGLPAGSYELRLWLQGELQAQPSTVQINLVP